MGMTKRQLLDALKNVDDEARVLVVCVASTNNRNHMFNQAVADMDANQGRAIELSEATMCWPSEEGPPFVVIEHHLEYV